MSEFVAIQTHSLLPTIWQAARWMLVIGNYLLHQRPGSIESISEDGGDRSVSRW